MTREQAEKELLQMLEESARSNRYYTVEEVHQHLDELFEPQRIVYLTGDTHGRFDRIEAFCHRREVEQENTFVILGDVGLNYFGDFRDQQRKAQLSQLPCTFFCIHGNHEQRPQPLHWVPAERISRREGLDGAAISQYRIRHRRGDLRFLRSQLPCDWRRLQCRQVVPSGTGPSLVAGRATLRRDPQEGGDGIESAELAD